MTTVERYEDAIARRNDAWSRWREANAHLALARQQDVADQRPYIANANAALDDYERAADELTRQRVLLRGYA